jgi:hypothetical protein
MHTRRDHERTVCQVAVQALAAERGGGAVRLVSIPEDAERREPAVDVISADGIGEFAAEHTRLDSFAGQSDNGAMVDKRLGPLERRLVGQLGVSGHYQFIVLGGRLGGGARGTAALQALETWIRETAPRVPEGGAASPPVEWVGLRVELRRWLARPGGPDGGTLTIVRASPTDLEQLRADQALRALQTKAPKLEAARGGHRTTVLALESADVALANRALVQAAVDEAVGRYDGAVPDAVVLVETDSLPWRSTCYATAVKPGAF